MANIGEPIEEIEVTPISVPAAPTTPAPAEAPPVETPAEEPVPV